MSLSRVARDSMERHLYECPTDSWLETYMATSQLHSGSPFVDAVLASIPQDVLNGRGWQPIVNSTKAGSSEDFIYRKLPEISNAIISAAMKADPAFCATNTPTGTDQRTISCQLEICDLPKMPHIACYTVGDYDVPSDTPIVRPLTKSPRGTPHQRTANHKLVQDTSVIAAIVPSKAHEGAEIDEATICDGAAEIMFRDPRRRFVFAFTIEGDMVTLWSFDREHVCRSEPFNLHEEPLYLIRFLLFLLSATVDRLGYDPTVTRRVVDSPAKRHKKIISYEYTVEGKSYLTEGNAISEFFAHHFLQRATRVWQVREIVSGKGKEPLQLSEKCYVLKDNWKYLDERLESDIQKDIFGRLREVDRSKNTDHTTKAKPYFMTFKHDWRVESLNGVLDNTFAPTIGTRRASFTRPGQKVAKTHMSDAQSNSSSTRDPSHNDSMPDSYDILKYWHTRSHVRTVYDEVCYSIYELRDYATMLRALKDIVTGLRYLRMAGFIHRDVSAGNCLWHIEGCTGKLLDLEYAIEYVEPSGHEPRTGTPTFMAVEYQDQDHLFLPPLNLDSFLSIQNVNNVNPFEKPLDDIPPFRFNFYHDLESVFWIYVWFLHHLLPTKVLSSRKSLHPLNKSAHEFIHPDPNLGNTQPRTRIITNGFSGQEVQTMVETLRDFYSTMWPLVSALSIADDMVESYTALEKTQPVIVAGKPCHWNPEFFTDDLYNTIRSKFQNILEVIEERFKADGDIPASWLLGPDPMSPSAPPSPTPKKRKGTWSEDDKEDKTKKREGPPSLR